MGACTTQCGCVHRAVWTSSRRNSAKAGGARAARSVRKLRNAHLLAHQSRIARTPASHPFKASNLPIGVLARSPLGLLAGDLAPGEAWVDSRKMLGIRTLFGDLNEQASQPLWVRKNYAVNEQKSFRQTLFAGLKQGPPDGLGFRPVTTNSRKNGAPEAAFKIAPKKWSVVLHSLQGRSA